MTAVEFNCKEHSYYGSTENETRATEASVQPVVIGPFDLSEHLLRDIGLLDGGYDGAQPGIVTSARDLIERYR